LPKEVRSFIYQAAPGKGSVSLALNIPEKNYYNNKRKKEDVKLCKD